MNYHKIVYEINLRYIKYILSLLFISFELRIKHILLTLKILYGFVHFLANRHLHKNNIHIVCYLKFNFIIISVASLNFINLLCKYNQLIFEFNHFLIFNLINFRLTNEI